MCIKSVILHHKWEKLVTKTRKKVQKNFAEIYDSLDFGLYAEPQQYFVSYIFKTDADLNTARESGLLFKISEYHKECLKNVEYPASAINDCVFASQEDCDRSCDGNWFYYYK